MLVKFAENSCAKEDLTIMMMQDVERRDFKLMYPYQIQNGTVIDNFRRNYVFVFT